MMTLVVFMEVMIISFFVVVLTIDDFVYLWIKKAIILEQSYDIFILFLLDSFPNISNGQVVQYETSSCFMDSKHKYKEYHEKYLKIDGLSKDGVQDPSGTAVVTAQEYERPSMGKGEDFGTKKKKNLDRAYASFKNVKKEILQMQEKTQETVFKSVLPKLVNTLSFNDKIINGQNSAPHSQVKKSTIIRLSMKRTSVDGEENEFCEYLASFLYFIFSINGVQ